MLSFLPPVHAAFAISEPETYIFSNSSQSTLQFAGSSFYRIQMRVNVSITCTPPERVIPGFPLLAVLSAVFIVGIGFVASDSNDASYF